MCADASYPEYPYMEVIRPMTTTYDTDEKPDPLYVDVNTKEGEL